MCVLYIIIIEQCLQWESSLEDYIQQWLMLQYNYHKW